LYSGNLPFLLQVISLAYTDQDGYPHWAISNGGLPISRVAPLDQLLPLSYEDINDFLSNNCSIRTRYLHFNTIFPKSTV